MLVHGGDMAAGAVAADPGNGAPAAAARICAVLGEAAS